MSYTLNTESQFIKLRALGHSLDSISKELGIARSTLSIWDKEYADVIKTTFISLKDTIISETVAQLGLDFKTRISTISEDLKKIDTELSCRDLSDVPTQTLYAMKIKLLTVAENMIRDTPASVKLHLPYIEPADRVKETEND